MIVWCGTWGRQGTLMWDNTRLVVFTAICASLYAAILIPFKVLPIIPGVTELRPANAVPVICSFLFGPAAAWGAAIGNVIGDFFGGIGPGDVFGFWGNFLYGLAPLQNLAPYRQRPARSQNPACMGPIHVHNFLGQRPVCIVHWLGAQSVRVRALLHSWQYHSVQQLCLVHAVCAASARGDLPTGGTRSAPVPSTC